MNILSTTIFLIFLQLINFPLLFLVREHQFLLSTQLDRSGGEKIAHQYNFNGFKGYAGSFYPETMTMVRTASEVKYIEPVGIASITGLSDYFKFNKKPKASVSSSDSLVAQAEQTKVDAWGLTRIWQRNFTNKNTYKYPVTAGENVDVYVIDTGVMTNHTDFEGRARWGKVVPKGSTEKDGNGHGEYSLF
jgi:cerevisin